MKLSLFMRCLAGSLLLVLTLAVSRADFDWNQASGPPHTNDESACSASPACAGAASPTCIAVDPPISLVPDGGKNSVLVKAYNTDTTYTYGTCQSGGTGTCAAYPNVKCAKLQIYGLSDCTSSWGYKTVYSGNCSP